MIQYMLLQGSVPLLSAGCAFFMHSLLGLGVGVGKIVRIGGLVMTIILSKIATVDYQKEQVPQL